MEVLCKICVLALITQACLGVRVTLVNGRTGTVPFEQEQGMAVTLPCSASPSVAFSGEPRLEWLYDTSPNSAGTHLVFEGIVQGDSDITISNPYSLVVANLQSSDSGFYTCRVTMLGDNPSQDAAVYNFTVLVPPDDQISCGFPSDLKITLGQSTEFHCREVNPQAVPAPTYIWFKNGVQLPVTSQGVPAYANSSFSYSPTEGILRFSSVVAGDKGNYYCRAENSVGSSQCTEATISTQEKNIGAIVGIVFGVIFALILIGVLIWWTWRRGYCDGIFDSDKDHDDDAPDDGANDIMLDGAGPLVTREKEPSDWSDRTSNKDSLPPSGRMPEGAVRVMP